MPRVRRKSKLRHDTLSPELADYLFSDCGNRLGLFGVDIDLFVRFADDPAGRREWILGLWEQHGDELLAKWRQEHPDVVPAIVRYGKRPATDSNN